MRRKSFIARTLAVLLASAGAATAAEKVVTWDDEVCSYSIRFDPAKYEPNRVANTVRLLFGPSDFDAPILDLVDDPKSLSKLDLAQTQQKCEDTLAKANQIEFLPLEGIDKYRSALIAQIKDRCAFNFAEIKSIQNPSALREYTPAVNACLPFIEALEGKADMPKFFRNLVDQNCRDNASPAQCVARQVANSQKSDGSAWMRLYLLNFGWHNCANNQTLQASTDLAPMRADIQKLFKRQFKVRKSKCDNGD